MKKLIAALLIITALFATACASERPNGLTREQKDLNAQRGANGCHQHDGYVGY